MITAGATYLEVENAVHDMLTERYPNREDIEEEAMRIATREYEKVPVDDDDSGDNDADDFADNCWEG